MRYQRERATTRTPLASRRRSAASRVCRGAPTALEVAAFNALLAEYSKAPEVTRRRLYLEPMSEVLPKVKNKVIVRARRLLFCGAWRSFVRS